MDNNPFLKRATEYFRRDDEAFLAVVTPEPVTYFLSSYAQEGLLYDRLVVIQGTPGSGKTTLAQLFEYPTLVALLRNPDACRPLYSAMSQCKAIANDAPTILGCRLSLETDYRDFWEFPYPPSVKLGLLTALIQARAVLAWIHNLVASGIDLNRVEIVPRQDAMAPTEMIGGTQMARIEERAQEIELSIYKVIAALVAPELSDLDSSITEAYHPFDVIEYFRVEGSPDGPRTVELLPLVILDDAHLLHPTQFQALQHWLARRELRASRWMMTRLDVLKPEEALAAATEDRADHVQLPGITTGRDIVQIMLQNTGERKQQRTAFRKMASDMANRYLKKMSLFSGRNLDQFSILLSSKPTRLTAAKSKELEASVTAVQRQLRISDARRGEISKQIDKYDPSGKKVSEETRLGVLSILMYRYYKRTGQGTLFEADPDPEPSRPLIVDSSIIEAARLMLLHKYDLPFYFGMDDLCDASSENAEQFLHLAAVLVEHSAVQLIRSKSATLDAAIQHRLMRQRASEILHHWNFPQYQLVRSLVDRIAQRCLKVSLEPNAPIGATAYGIRQDEFDTLPSKHYDLASVLQFGVAYNAFSLVPNYSCKKENWCLLELGGIAILHYGLTLKRGGFIEGNASELTRMLAEGD